jgi:hypothetical protein
MDKENGPKLREQLGPRRTSGKGWSTCLHYARVLTAANAPAAYGVEPAGSHTLQLFQVGEPGRVRRVLSKAATSRTHHWVTARSTVRASRGMDRPMLF